MYCVNCGRKLSDDAKFCDVCGTKVGADVCKENTSRDSEKDGKVFKCPYCGEILPSNAITCPMCGKEIRGRELSKAVQKFNDELNRINDQNKKIEFIKTYFIPNNREDIFEFMFMSSSNYFESCNKDNKSEIAEAWLTKVNQCYEKAKFLFTNQNDINQITEIYKKTISAKKDKIKKKKKILILGILFLALAVILFIVSFIFMNRTNKIEIPATEGHEATTDLDTSDPNYLLFMIFGSCCLLGALPAGIILTTIAAVNKIKKHK